MRDETKRWPARTSHQLPTTTADMVLSTALRSIGHPRRISEDTPADSSVASLAARTISPVSQQEAVRNAGQGSQTRISAQQSCSSKANSTTLAFRTSKYPLGSALPDFEPTRETCERCIDIAKHVRDSAMKFLDES